MPVGFLHHTKILIFGKCIRHGEPEIPAQPFRNAAVSLTKPMTFALYRVACMQ